MQTLESILNIVHNLLKQEVENGCRNDISPDGMQLSIRNQFSKTRPLNLDMGVRAQLREVYACFNTYSQATPIERIHYLEKARKLIERMITNSSVVNPKIESSEIAENLDRNESIAPARSVDTDSDTINFLTITIDCIKGIGPRSASKLESELGIRTIGQLLEYVPRAYHDQSQVTPIGSVSQLGDNYTIQGKVAKQSYIPSRRPRGKAFAKIAIYDGTGIAQLVIFGNQRISYLRKTLSVGTSVVISGKFERRQKEIQSSNFEFEIITDNEEGRIHTGRIVPQYRTTMNLTQRSLRQWVKNALDNYITEYPEFLAEEIRIRNELIDWPNAVSEIHFPSSPEMINLARRRLVFNEFFLLQIWLSINKKSVASVPGISFTNHQLQGKTSLVEQFLLALPFELTKAQKRSFDQIKMDMERDEPMNRLLQGDVGSGKTMVAALALLKAVQCGYQAVLMVPTEVLADQHAINLKKTMSDLEINVGLLKGDLGKRERDQILKQISDGQLQIIVGTHAIIQESVIFNNLGLAIIDEQHRFGVLQRAKLRDKGPANPKNLSNQLVPDILVMTATPIPRTLSMTIYGDLNVSVIDELPPGRQEIKTEWIKDSERDRLYQQLHKEIEKGRQVYVVYPLVEESENLEDIKAATEMAEQLQQKSFPDQGVGLLHGRMKSSEKQSVMANFKDGKLDILVSTTVIEVGVDVPNATIIVIENAERFGLAQLHQLRGRVGRGQHQSWCYLVSDPKSDDGIRRIEAMTQTNNGFDLSEIDLEIRGPGEFFGTRQSGLPEFKVADVIRDANILEATKLEAEIVVNRDPNLVQNQHKLIKVLVEKEWSSKRKLIQS